ncbi:MAG: segregation and condensation protein A [Terriglobia bacterium]
MLLDLVRQHRLNILDLPIAEVTRQYLDYIHRAQELNIELGAEFVFMAATLILIKSRTLLPRERVEPDPREELVEQIISHEQTKQIGDFLGGRLLETANTWSVPGSVEELTDFDSHPVGEPLDQPDAEPATKTGNINLLDALRIMQKALAVARTRRLLISQRHARTLEEMIGWLTTELEHLNGKGFFTLEELFRAQATIEHQAMLFLAVLELARRRNLHLEQEGYGEPVRITATQSGAG